MLSSNPNVISILEKNLDKIKWHKLSSNKNVIKLYWEPNYNYIFKNMIEYYIILRNVLIHDIIIYILKKISIN